MKRNSCLIFTFICVYVFMSACLHVCPHMGQCLERPEEGAGFPGARVPCCEPPDVSAGNWAWVFSARAAPLFNHWTVCPALWCPVVSWGQSAPLLDGPLWERCVWACSVLQNAYRFPLGFCASESFCLAFHFIWLHTLEHSFKFLFSLQVVTEYLVNTEQ